MNNLVKRPSATPLEPRTLEEAMRYAQMLARSSMVPKDFQNKPENVLVALQWGREIGLGPLQALQNIAVVNGRPSLWGDAALALVRASGLCASINEAIEGDGDAMRAICRVRRRGDSGEVVSEFSTADAKRAGLWGGNVWAKYPKRMMQMRARGFALRDAFPDVLRGIVLTEEAQDITPSESTFSGVTIESRDDDRSLPAVQTDVAPDLDDPEAPEYPLMMKSGGRIVPTGSEWIEAWRKVIGNYQAVNALDKLSAARDLNMPAINSVREFDPHAADEVERMIGSALKVTPDVT